MLTDFDGTISEVDVAYSIVKEFSTGDWKGLERKYQTGEITSRQELPEQFILVKASKAQILDFVDKNMRLDATFSEFKRFCDARSIPVLVVSEGLDFYIHFMFEKYGVDVDVLVNSARFTSEGLKLEFQSTGLDCEKCGNCKLEHLQTIKGQGKKIIYIGDGSSDFCAAKEADIIFAKRKLAIHLDDENIEHFKYEKFDDIVRILEGLLE